MCEGEAEGALQASESPAGGTQDRGVEGYFLDSGRQEGTNTVWNYKANFKALAPGQVLCPFSHVAHFLFPALRMVLTSEARPLAPPH